MKDNTIMATKLKEITVQMGRVLFRFGDRDCEQQTIVAEAFNRSNQDNEKIQVKGKKDGDHPQLHLSYRLYGYWKKYTNRRTNETTNQFNFKMFVPAKPHGRAGIETYLCQLKGIGPATAAQLFYTFQGQAVQILREQPSVAATAVRQLKLRTAQAAAIWLEDRASMEDCMIELIELFDRRGFPKGTAQLAIKEWVMRRPKKFAKNRFSCINFVVSVSSVVIRCIWISACQH